ncbi:MAG: hypothetical protein SVV03_02520 [Candidatus Nanohaloarchaea archaeon]|nr:hypothetical protein [Candidatus Nanohaloarchaea archaeon]
MSCDSNPWVLAWLVPTFYFMSAAFWYDHVEDSLYSTEKEELSTTGIIFYKSGEVTVKAGVKLRDGIFNLLTEGGDDRSDE